MIRGKGLGNGKDKRGAVAALATVLALAMVCLAALAGPKKKLPAKPIDLNRATLEQLESLPGVGPAMARRILDFREKSGPFRRVEELLAVRGISRGRFEKIRPYIVVHPARGGRQEKPKGEARHRAAG